MRYLKVTAVTLASLAMAGAIFWLALGLFPNPLEQPGGWDYAVKITDRHGRLLKEILPPGPARRESAPDGYGRALMEAVLAAEDKRFYRHLGVDPLAMLRALRLNLKYGRIKSGGSTITMQLARLRRGLSPGPRTMSRKIREIWWALLIERHNAKEVILAEYLSRAPCGNLTEGFAAAARFYLDKPPADLSYGEAAFLAGLPASPGALNPYKDPRPALARRALVLDRMAALKFLTPEEAARAKNEPLALARPGRQPFHAPHFVAQMRKSLEPLPPETLVTTLDLDLQQKLEALARQTVKQYSGQGLTQAALVVMTIAGREVLAWVGSADFFSAHGGQNDGVTAQRQPGSALKPFLYAAALEKGIITAASLIDDRPADYRTENGSFSPANYSRRFHGPVSARLALASSLNLPAVRLASALGAEETLAALRGAGFSLNRQARHYGLGLALGGGEVDLLRLTQAYAALADGGLLARPVTRLSPPQESEEPARIMAPGAAFIITDILGDDLARSTGFGRGGPLATPYPSFVKTGTSKNFRDNWCVGFTDKFVIGVWAGNFEAAPMAEVSGVTGAGTLWRQAADLLAQKYPPQPYRPPNDVVTLKICPASGLLAGPDCPASVREYFLAARARPGQCQHRKLLENPPPVIGPAANGFGLIRPVSGEEYALDPGLSGRVQNIKALAALGRDIDETVWLLNGRELARKKEDLESCLVPLARGPMRLTVIGLSKGEKVGISQADFTVY